jgi:hypothetical protein
VGSWNVLDTIAIADCALEIHADDLEDLFATAARARSTSSSTSGCRS